jgi:4a-hydroxytetrahydrobiopterin dehydratase
MALLAEDEVDAAVRGTPWRREGSTLVRDLQVADFPAAIAFVDRVAQAAEEAGHHPDILVHGWNRVRLTLSTHSEGGITQADLDLARVLDARS